MAIIVTATALQKNPKTSPKPSGYALRYETIKKI
jgi:hypothetical protein